MVFIDVIEIYKTLKNIWEDNQTHKGLCRNHQDAVNDNEMNRIKSQLSCQSASGMGKKHKILTSLCRIFRT